MARSAVNHLPRLSTSLLSNSAVRQDLAGLLGGRRWIAETRGKALGGPTGAGVLSQRGYNTPHPSQHTPRPNFHCTSRRHQSSPAADGPLLTPPLEPLETRTPPPRSSRLLGSLITTSLVLLAFSAGAIMSAAPAADTVKDFLSPPSDSETLNLFEAPTPTAAEINEHILTNPLAVRLRASPGVTESRPHLKIPAAMRPHNLTAGVLTGEGKIEVPPLSFAETELELPTLTQISYLGPDLCGHPGIIHGGLLATLLDEGLARACFPALPNKVGVTASLKIDYRVPCPANSYVVLKAHTTKVEGRKAWVTGWIELLGEGDAEGTKLVEAEALFIEPRGAKNMARIYSTQ